MLDTQRYFLASGRGQQASRPAKEPPSIISDDPVADFRDIRSDMIDTYGDPAVVEKTGPALGIAFADMVSEAKWYFRRAHDEAQSQVARSPSQDGGRTAH